MEPDSNLELYIDYFILPFLQKNYPDQSKIFVEKVEKLLLNLDDNYPKWKLSRLITLFYFHKMKQEKAKRKAKKRNIG
jgi:hypothetical protein